MSRVFFREKIFVRTRSYHFVSSVFERNFFGKLLAVSQLARQNCSRDVYKELQIKNLFTSFFYEWFLTFEEESFGLLAKNFRLTCQYYIPCIQNHFPRWIIFVFFNPTNLSKFVSSFGRKIGKFGGNISTGLLMLRSSCRERKSKQKKFLEN